MRIQCREVTAAERGGDHFDSDLLRVQWTHFHFLYHQCVSSSPWHRNFLSNSLNKQQWNVINLDKQIITINSEEKKLESYLCKWWHWVAWSKMNLLPLILDNIVIAWSKMILLPLILNNIVIFLSLEFLVYFIMNDTNMNFCSFVRVT